jgi:glycosyltransferase involved in cell wall biosynthesis
VREAPVTAGKYGFAEHFAVPAAARRAGAGLLHEPHYTLPVGWSGPSVVTVHDLTHLRFPHFFPPGAALYARAMAGFAVGRARRVIVDSEDTRIDVIERLGADPERVRVIHLGVSPGLVRPPADEIESFREPLRLPPGYLLYVGARKRHKNLGLLIDALARIPEHARPPLVLSGRPLTPDDPLMRQAQARGVERWLHTSGLVHDDAALSCLYAGAALYLQPSLAEGFGLPPLEAMACGVPVVSSNAGSLPEVLGDAAVLLPPRGLDAIHQWADTIVRLLGDDAERIRMAAAGRAQAARFTWEKAAAATLAIYREALAR